MMRSLTLCVALGLASPALSQARLIVPDEYPGIQAAIDAASPGDVVLVRPGVLPWGGFHLDKSLSIVALDAIYTNKATIRVSDSSEAIHVDLEDGEQANIVGFDILEPFGSPGGFSMVTVDGGVVTLEDCTISGGSDPNGFGGVATLNLFQTRAVLLRTWLTGGIGGMALTAYDSDVSAVSSRALGGFDANGTHVFLTEMHASDCLFQGGDSAQGQGGVALLIAPNSRARISDSDVVGGVGTAGGAALVNQGTVPVDLARNRLIGGAGFTPGPDSVGPINATAPLLGVRESRRIAQVGTLRLGQSVAPFYMTSPGESVVVLIAAGVGEPVSVSLFDAGFWLRSPVFPVQASVATPEGFVWVSLSIPVDPALHDLRIAMQGFAGMTLPLATSPVTGGTIRR